MDELVGLALGLIGLLIPLLRAIHNQRGLNVLEIQSLAAGIVGGSASYSLLRVYRLRVERARELGSDYPHHGTYHLAMLLGPLGGLPLLLVQRLVLGFPSGAATASSACYFFGAGGIMLLLAVIKTRQNGGAH